LVEDGNGEIYKENASEGELSNLRSIVQMAREQNAGKIMGTVTVM
jgi:hypothetical protein